MLTLFDTRAGEPRPVPAARPGWLGTTVVAGPATGPGRRACLVADLIRRAGTHHHLRAETRWLGAGEDLAALARACEAMNVPPASTSPGPPAWTDVWVTAGGEVPGEAPGLLVRVTAAGTAREGAATDPLAVRLALLGRHYREQVDLTGAALAEADAALTHWRRLVADWARSPSVPAPAAYVSAVIAALDDDLDTPAVLTVMMTLAADGGVSDGAKFEAFALLDKFTGLDLARDVGRY